ncbi:ATP-binding cassette sub- A, partial [Sarracenia purpurea var. burkii]
FILDGSPRDIVSIVVGVFVILTILILSIPLINDMVEEKDSGVKLKGVSLKDAKIEANEYLTMMDMQSKKNSLAKELSGGMKRKLCLSIALMGNAQVLILDEPTSGMMYSPEENYGICC